MIDKRKMAVELRRICDHHAGSETEKTRKGKKTWKNGTKGTIQQSVIGETLPSSVRLSP
jgi:hypothetical protein